jgi:chorismate--pyruvate lyase
VTTPIAQFEPRWQPLHYYRQSELPAVTRRWLLDEGSLTDHLVQTSGGQFQVERLIQGWQVPKPSERRLLRMRPRQVALVREVTLHCQGQPWVFARSIIPLATLQGPLGYLRKLQNQSLGSLLFRHSNLGRSPFELALLAPQHHYLPDHLRQDAAAWGRRSRFSVDNHHLMVSEVFLQAFRPWLARKDSV